MWALACGLSFSAATEAQTPTAAVAAPRSTPPAEGRALEQSDHQVLIDIGTEDGLKKGQRIQFVMRAPAAFGLGEEDRVLAIGVVDAIQADRAVVRVGPNEHIPKGARAIATGQAPTANNIAPPRVGGVWDLRLSARPFLSVGNSGGGIFTDFELTRRFEQPLYARVFASPLAFATGENDPNAVGVIGATAGADFALIGLGIGVGAAFGSRLDAPNLSVHQEIRLGAIDGFHLRVHNAFRVGSEATEHLITDLQGAIPVADGLALTGQLGAGDVMGGYLDLGMRIRLQGNGGPGTISVTPSFGIATVGKVAIGLDPNDSSVLLDADYTGPSVALRLDWRL